MFLFFKNAKSDDMIEITHLKNEPWYKTLVSKGEKSKIDYILAFDDKSDKKNIIDNINDRKKIEAAFK